MSFKIITISREFGSGGRFIGEQIAQKCGIEFYDKKIIEHVAKELGISEQIVANQGEYAPAGSIFSYAFVGRDITGVSLSDQIFNIQQKLIKDIAQKEPCVIVGRCADYILSDRDDVLNVFIEGNKPEKAARIKKLYQKSDDEVKKLLKDVDKKRSVNYRYFTDKEYILDTEGEEDRIYSKKLARLRSTHGDYLMEGRFLAQEGLINSNEQVKAALFERADGCRAAVLWNDTDEDQPVSLSLEGARWNSWASPEAEGSGIPAFIKPQGAMLIYEA